MIIVPPPDRPDDKEPQGHAPTRIPSLRTYELRRFSPDGDGLAPTDTIFAHGVETVGDLLRFLKVIVDPETGPREVPVLAVNGWYDYKEIWAESSRLTLQ